MRRPLAILVVCGATATAVAAPAEVTVDQAIALYREKSARRVADRAEVDVAAADLVEAGIYPNPTLGVGTTRTVHGTDTIGREQLAASLDVPLLIGHQRARRADAARARIAAKRAEVEAGEGEAELAIRASFAALQAAQQRTATLASAVEDAQAARAIVAGRTAAGANSPYELERIDLAVAALASRLDSQRAEEAAASDELAAAVGILGWRPRATGTFAEARELATAVAADHPVLVAGRSELAAARADEVQAHADATPTPSLGVQTFGTTDPSGLAIGAGISVPLPLFDRNQGAIARARTEHHHRDLELAARSTELRLALEASQRQLALRQETLAQFRVGALARLPRIRAMAESAYRSGQGGIVVLLDALEAITEARLREIELAAAAVDAELAVRAAALGR